MQVLRKTTPSNWLPITVDDELLGEVNLRPATGMEFVSAVDLETRKYQKACVVAGDEDPIVYDQAGAPTLSQIQNAKMVYRVYSTYNWVGFRSAEAGTPFIELGIYDNDGNLTGTRPMKNTPEDKLFILESSPEFFEAFSKLVSSLNDEAEKEAEEAEELAKN